MSLRDKIAEITESTDRSDYPDYMTEDEGRLMLAIANSVGFARSVQSCLRMGVKYDSEELAQIVLDIAEHLHSKADPFFVKMESRAVVKFDE